MHALQPCAVTVSMTYLNSKQKKQKACLRSGHALCSRHDREAGPLHSLAMSKAVMAPSHRYRRHSLNSEARVDKDIVAVPLAYLHLHPGANA